MSFYTTFQKSQISEIFREMIENILLYIVHTQNQWYVAIQGAVAPKNSWCVYLALRFINVFIIYHKASYSLGLTMSIFVQSLFTKYMKQKKRRLPSLLLLINAQLPNLQRGADILLREKIKTKRKRTKNGIFIPFPNGRK